MKTVRIGLVSVALAAPLAIALLGAKPSTSRAQSTQVERQVSSGTVTEAASGTPLPTEGLVWVLDATGDKPQIKRLYLNSGTNNLHRGKNFLRAQVFMDAVATADLPNPSARIRIATDSPVIFVRMTTDEQEEEDSGRAGNASVVQRHFVLLRLHPTGNTRELFGVGAPMIAGAPTVKQDVVESTTQQIPGTPWRKITPAHPLADGEYAVALIPTDMKNAADMTTEAYDFGIGPATTVSRAH